VTVPLAITFGFANKHDDVFRGATHILDPAKCLAKLPSNMLAVITFLDFSQILSALTVVGSIESLLTVSAMGLLISALFTCGKHRVSRLFARFAIPDVLGITQLSGYEMRHETAGYTIANH
jgi:hypothetical protein